MGSYWVRVEDNNGCYANIDGNVVVLFAPVVVPQIIHPAAQKDTLNVCVNGDAFALQAVANATITAYEWIDQWGNTVSNDSIYIHPQDSMLVGTRQFTVKIAYEKDNNGGVCYATSKVFTVIINPAPPKPTLTIDAVDCSQYSIVLKASSNTAGQYSWSNGDISGVSVNQHQTTVNQGNLYSVTLHSGLLCTSQASIVVPNTAKEYFMGLPSGCYKLCIPAIGFNIPMPQSPIFSQWQWLLNGQSYISNINSVVASPLTVYSTGSYMLLANNGLCTDTAFNAVLDISQPDSCGEAQEQQCDFKFTLNAIHFNCSCDTVIGIDYTIDNNNTSSYNNNPIAFTASTQPIAGLIQGGILQPGSNAFSTTLLLPFTGQQNIQATLKYYVKDGKNFKVCKAIESFDIDNKNCVNTCKRKFWYAKNSKVNESMNSKTLTTQMSIIPNPAHSQVLVQVNKDYVGGSLKIINSFGNTTKELRILQQNNTIAIHQLPKGLYYVQAINKEGKMLTSKLVVE
jgi:hypothetical protein